MTVSVCIPAYNEGERLVKCASVLYEKMNALREREAWDFELIFCDDGSTDDSFAALTEFSSDKPEIRLVGYPQNHGKGSAVREAVKSSVGDVVIFTDCDLAYGVDVIEKAVGAVKGGADVAAGSRNLTKGGYGEYSALRRFASKIYIKVLSVLGGLHVSDSQCGFKAFDGDGARMIFSLCTCDGFAFDYEVLMIAEKLGKKISGLPVTIVNHGSSSVSVIRDSIKMVKDVLKIKKRVSKLDLSEKGDAK
ncbi:MAG: glycosyltransferase [Clostridia bacterium]|nr:glycosyltransferase [Clostridia bacterium]